MKTYKTKTATRNAIIKTVHPLTTGFFKDNSWENVRKVWKSMEDNGVVVTVTDAKYDGVCPPTSKTWSFTAEVNGFYFNGNLTACFCGTVDDPTNRYDLCFLLY